jgi:hypothetical protein
MKKKGAPAPPGKKDLGICVATNKIMVDGMKVGFMYREEVEEELDSGWRFFSGTEEQDYVDNPENSGIYDVETILLQDSAVKQYLKMPVGTELERVEGTNQFKPI